MTGVPMARATFTSLNRPRERRGGGRARDRALETAFYHLRPEGAAKLIAERRRAQRSPMSLLSA